MYARQRLVCSGLLALAVLLVAGLLQLGAQPQAESQAAESSLTLADIPFDGARAYEHLKQICELGPRPSGSPGMKAQQEMLADHFTRLGGKVALQRFRARHPLDGSLVPMANLIVEWHPERRERILLCAHYDTRPLPDNDPNPAQRRGGRFIGANDGASGVALLMELAHAMPELESKYGVDFVLFDAEELVYGDRGTYFLGSEWFARKYIKEPQAHRYRWGVLLDMVADADLNIYQERNSMSWPETRPLVIDIWNTAARLGVEEFIPERKHEIRDDHLPLRNVAKIPTCNIIDFDYPDAAAGNRYWHTTLDVPERCSPLSLAKVGWVVQEWLKKVD